MTVARQHLSRTRTRGQDLPLEPNGKDQVLRQERDHGSSLQEELAQNLVWSTPKPVWFPRSPRPCFYSNNPGGYIYNSGGSGIRMEVGWLFPPFLCRRHRVFSRRKGWVGAEEEKIIERTEFTTHKVPNPGSNQMFVCLPYAFNTDHGEKKFCLHSINCCFKTVTHHPKDKSN